MVWNIVFKWTREMYFMVLKNEWTFIAFSSPPHPILFPLEHSKYIAIHDIVSISVYREWEKIRSIFYGCCWCFFCWSGGGHIYFIRLNSTQNLFNINKQTNKQESKIWNSDKSIAVCAVPASSWAGYIGNVRLFVHLSCCDFVPFMPIKYTITLEICGCCCYCFTM